jgi:hypothetical protein
LKIFDLAERCRGLLQEFRSLGITGSVLVRKTAAFVNLFNNIRPLILERRSKLNLKPLNPVPHDNVNGAIAMLGPRPCGQ